MRLLVDTDAFCRLAASGLLEEAAALFGATIDECGRLSALHYMLRGGRLRESLGAALCEGLVSIARAMPVSRAPSALWLDQLVGIESIDPGEAQLLALSAETALPLITNDKRALRAVREAPIMAAALSGRIVTLEAVLLSLCARLGATEVRRRLAPAIGMDHMIRVCFSPDNPDPELALQSYYEELSSQVAPLVLWRPGAEIEP